MTSILLSTPLSDVPTIWPGDAATLRDRNVVNVNDLVQRVERDGYGSLADDSSIPRENLENYCQAARVELSQWRFTRNTRIGLSVLLAILFIACWVSVPMLREQADKNTQYTSALNSFSENHKLDKEQAASLEKILSLYEPLSKITDPGTRSDELEQLEKLVGKGKSNKDTLLRAREAVQLLGVYRYTLALNAISKKQVDKNEIQRLWQDSRRVDYALGQHISAANKNLDTFKKTSNLILFNAEKEISTLGDDTQLATVHSLEQEMMEYPDTRLMQQREREWEERKQEIQKILDTRFDPLTKSVDGLDKKMVGLDSKMETLDEQVGTLKTTVNDSGAALTRTSEKLDELSNKVAVNHSGAISQNCGFVDTGRAEAQLDDLCKGGCPNVGFDLRIERIEGIKPIVEFIGGSPATEDPAVISFGESVINMLTSGDVEIKPGVEHTCRIIFK